MEFFLSSFAVAISLGLYIFCVRNGNGIDRRAASLQGYYLIFFFFLAPLLHIFLDTFVDVSISDWNAALTKFNMMNAIGLLFAIIGFKFGRGNFNLRPRSVLNWGRLQRICIFVATLGALVYLLMWIVAPSSMLLGAGSEGEGPLPIYFYMLVECIPMLVGWIYISANKKKNRNLSPRGFWVIFLIVAVLSIIFSGMRGSRVSVIFQVLSFVLLYDAAIQRIRIGKLLILAVAAISFNSIFSVYKYGGVDAFSDYASNGERSEYVEKVSAPARILLHDFGRADVAALVLDRATTGGYRAPLFPETYLYGIQLLLPQSLRSEDFSSKTVLGASAQYQVSIQDAEPSSRIYGVIAESILNFGLLLLPFVFLFFGYVHRRTLTAAVQAKENEFLLFYPLFVLAPIFFLFYDFDNILFLLVKTWLIPAVVFVVSGKSRLLSNAS
ncbi:hypothetical protein [Variovorax boronicumulans]|uniref:hypothetical protein n=1 Tax=Variovorax boronicumulans TaxID=436515 RepID=UPI001C575F22